MSEMNHNLPPTFTSALNESFAAPQPDPAFVDRLGVQLRRRQMALAKKMQPVTASKLPFVNKRRSFMQTLRARPLIAILLAILALLLVTGMAYAIARLSGFIPGIGFVQNVHSILETPIVVTREAVPTPSFVLSGKVNLPEITQTLAPTNTADVALNSTSLPVQKKQGITITIEQVVAEAGRLVIVYQINGFPGDFFGPARVPTLQAFVQAHPDDPMPEQVRLPDGSFLEHASGGHCTGEGHGASSSLSCESIYAPLPKGVNQFTFQIHRLQNALPGELPEDWAFSIQLTPVSSSSSANGVQELNLSSSSVNGITLRLLKVSPYSSQTAFQLGLDWEGQNRMIDHIDPITLQDDQGHAYPLSSGQEGDQWSPDHPNSIIFASEIADLAVRRRPLTFRMNWVVMTATDQAILPFDFGKGARTGQEWEMDQTVHHAGGFDLHFTHARLKTDPDGTLILEFDIQAPKEIYSILIEGAGIFASGGDYDTARGVWVSHLALPAIPDGPVDLVISQIQYQVNGPWIITWQP